MKFTIEGFSQQRAVELGLSVEDLVILRWFVDFWPSPKMVKMESEGKIYALVSYSSFIEQMPIIGCNKRTIARKFQRLVEANVLENTTIKQGGSFSVYRFGSNYDSLVNKSVTVAQYCTEGLHKNEQPGMYENEHTNTNLFNYTNQYKTKERKKEKTTTSDSLNQIVESYTQDPEVKSLLVEWLKIRELKKAVMTDRALTMNLKKMESMAKESHMSKKQYLEEVVMRGWVGFYKINNSGNSNFKQDSCINGNSNKNPQGEFGFVERDF